MRKAKLSLEKHLLPSSKSEVAKHEADLLFSIHNEAVEVIRDYYKIKSRTAHHDKQKVVAKVKYCYNAIRSIMINGFDNDGVNDRIQFHIRTSAVDGLVRVEADCLFILNMNEDLTEENEK